TVQRHRQRQQQRVGVPCPPAHHQVQRQRQRNQHCGEADEVSRQLPGGGQPERGVGADAQGQGEQEQPRLGGAAGADAHGRDSGGHQVPPPVLSWSSVGRSLRVGSSVPPSVLEPGSSLGSSLGPPVASSVPVSDCSVSWATICSASVRSSALMVEVTRACTNGGRSSSSTVVTSCCRDSSRGPRVVGTPW